MERSTNIATHVKHSAIIATAGVVLTFLTLVAIEPQITHSQVQDTSEFTIQQTITGETSFSTPAPDVVMSGNIAGLTGGNATGTTQFAVRTNNASGYFVEIEFFDNGSDHAMMGDINFGDEIRNYSGDNGLLPSNGFAPSATQAEFAYSVNSSSSPDTAAAFRNGGGACGVGGTDDFSCWKAPSSTAFEIARRAGPASNGATTSVQFVVNVPSGASPAPNAETYTATATLSLFNI